MFQTMFNVCGVCVYVLHVCVACVCVVCEKHRGMESWGRRGAVVALLWMGVGNIPHKPHHQCRCSLLRALCQSVMRTFGVVCDAVVSCKIMIA
jgi:hypothetical protein